MRARPSLTLLILLAVAAPARPAAAQFRYLLSTDLHEQWNSNVFAGVAAPDWDLITEIQPGFRAYYYQRASLLWLSYHFTLQTFARTMDPAANRKLLGYGNRLNLEYTRLLTQTSGLRFFTRFAQGTEDVQIPGGVSPTGGIETGYLATGSIFLMDDSRLELQHLWSRRLSSRLHLDSSVYQAFGRAGEPRTLIAPPDSWALAPTHRLDYALQNDLLRQDTTLTTVVESRDFYPRALVTVFFDLSGGWRHYFTEFWDVSLRAGLDVRARQLLDPVTLQSSFESGVGPLGELGVRYRRGHRVMVGLEYSHIYALTQELGPATTADSDQVAAYGEWRLHRDWLLEGMGTFRYLRMPANVPGIGLATTKVATARASVAYQITPGLSVDVGYDLELMRDRPVFTETGQPGLGLLPSDYTRHLVSAGLSIAWPPLPPQETQLTRRASLAEPIFTMGPEGVAATELRHADDDLPREREERARRAKRARELGQEEPVEPEFPIEELMRDEDR